MTTDFLKKQYANYLLKQHFFVEEDKIFMQKLSELQSNETIDYSHLSAKFIHFLINESDLNEKEIQDLIKEELICMPYEKTINHLKTIKNQLNERQNKKQMFYCGIKAIDQMVLGFHQDKIYSIVSEKEELVNIFFTSITANLSLMYDNEFLNHLNLKNPKILDDEANLTNTFNLFYLQNDITNNPLCDQKYLLEYLPQTMVNHSDVVIFLNQATAETAETDGEESSSEHIIEFTILKNHKHILGTDKLEINSSQQLQSIKSAYFLDKFMRKLKGLL